MHDMFVVSSQLQPILCLAFKKIKKNSYLNLVSESYLYQKNNNKDFKSLSEHAWRSWRFDSWKL